MLRRSLALAAVSLLALPSFGQVRHAGEPVARDHPLGAVPTVTVPAPDVDALLREDEQPKVGPFRYGVVLPTEIDVTLDGALAETPDGKLVSRVRIESPGAKSLGLEFSRWEIPAGGEVYVYDATLEHVLGMYDSRNRISTGEFVIEPFPGEALIVEYSQPADLDRYGEIVVDGVIYDYKDILALERDGLIPQDLVTEGGCPLKDVNCPEGDPFPLQKRATMRTLFGGGVCSAVLINNTASDGTQYVYTANHCGQGSTTVFRFNYQASGCGTGGSPTNQNVGGAQVLATDQDTDGRFMRITNPIPSNYLPYYSGWTRQTGGFNFGLSMHHPGGGPKKISIDPNGGFQTGANFQGIGFVKVWSVTFPDGATAGGSSGGPLWDQNNRLRGTLTGGPQTNCQISLYGRFHNFYGEANLAQWLDPLGSNPTSHDGFDPFGVPPLILSLQPASVKAFSPPAVTVNGAALTGISEVTVDGEAVVSGVMGIDANTATFTPPKPSSLGTVPVTVTTPGGTSNPLNLTYVETSPPAIAGLDLAIGGQPYVWSFGGGAFDAWFLIVAVDDDTTFPLGNDDVLLNHTLVGSGLLNAAGLGERTLLLPSGEITDQVEFYSQVVTFDGVNIDASGLLQTTKFF